MNPPCENSLKPSDDLSKSTFKAMLLADNIILNTDIGEHEVIPTSVETADSIKELSNVRKVITLSAINSTALCPPKAFPH